jgi:hypothetical protein
VIHWPISIHLQLNCYRLVSPFLFCSYIKYLKIFNKIFSYFLKLTWNWTWRTLNKLTLLCIYHIILFPKTHPLPINYSPHFPLPLSYKHLFGLFWQMLLWTFVHKFVCGWLFAFFMHLHSKVNCWINWQSYLEIIMEALDFLCQDCHVLFFYQ